MDYYYGVIYYKDGRKEETGTFSGPGAEASCERQTAMLFENRARTAINDYFKPSRYEVRKK